MNDERTDFEVALDDLLQVARHAPRTGEGYQEIQAARRTFLSACSEAAPGEVRLTTDEAAWVRTWLEPLDQWSSPMAKQIAAKIDAAAAPGER